MEAWIDREAKIVSFHQIEGEKFFALGEEEFWQYILDLVSCGYRLQ